MRHGTCPAGPTATMPLQAHTRQHGAMDSRYAGRESGAPTYACSSSE